MEFYAPSDKDAIENATEDDCFIEPCGHLGSKLSVAIDSKHLGEFSDTESMEQAIKDWMDTNKYFPNVWYISDHGNVSQYKLENKND